MLAALLFYTANVNEWLGDASDAKVDPLSAVFVGFLCFITTLSVEWSLKRQGFLASVKMVPDVASTPPSMAEFWTSAPSSTLLDASSW